jgi:glycosyltransferase involved in cell wall biosynthesis
MNAVRVRFVRQPPRAPQVDGVVDISRPPSDSLISCIMPTRGFAFPARLAIACFRNQTYRNRELVIVSTAVDSEVKALVAELGDPRIRMVEAPDAKTVGVLRNVAIAEAAGDLISIWDDDDLSHPDRLWWQCTALEQARGDACFLSNVVLWWPARSRLAISSTRRWEGTMLVKRSSLPSYPDMNRGEDTALVNALQEQATTLCLERPMAYCYVRHGSNIWADGHFDYLFDTSNQQVSPEAYAGSLRHLARWMPIDEYQAGQIED